MYISDAVFVQFPFSSVCPICIPFLSISINIGYVHFVFYSLVFTVIVIGRIILVSMGEEKPDTLDFVKDFQEYLSQQTQHVNMISGSVSGVKEADELPPGNGSSTSHL